MLTAGARIAYPIIMLVCGNAAAHEFLVWSQVFGTGASQSAELLIDNTDCSELVTVTVTTTDSSGSIAHELAHVVQQGAVIVPLPESSAPADRTGRGLEVSVEPESCAGLTYASLAIVNGDGATAGMHYGAEWTDYNTHDPGITATEVAQNIRIHIAPTRVGLGQTAEVLFHNTCPEDIVVMLDVTDLSTGVSHPVDLKVAPWKTGVLPLASVANGLPTYFKAEGYVRDAEKEANPCPSAFGAVVGTLELVDAQGNTAATGLPTGKRQHKPVSVVKPIDKMN
jgi:hypothetical protein